MFLLVNIGRYISVSVSADGRLYRYRPILKNRVSVAHYVKELAPAAARLYAGDITAVAALYDGDATE